jgi:hypothetical protein
MLSTLLLYPPCPECGGNLPFVSRRIALNARAEQRSLWRSRRDYPEMDSIECSSCGAGFHVEEKWLAPLAITAAVIGAVGYLIWGGNQKPGVGFGYFFGGSILALIVARLIGNRLTALTRRAQPGDLEKENPAIADVFARLEARDAALANDTRPADGLDEQRHPQ